MAITEIRLPARRAFGLFSPHPALPRPHLLTPAGRFAVLCAGAMFVGAAIAFAT